MSETFTDVFEGCAKWVRENAKNATANQYLLDTGEEACRGFTFGGVHLWEHLKSTGMEHFKKGSAPLQFTGEVVDGLYTGESYLPLDEIKSATLKKEKLTWHWNLSKPKNDGDLTRYSKLKDVDWKMHVFFQHDEKGNEMLYYYDGTVSRATLLGEHIPEKNGYLTVFHFGSCMPVLIPYIHKAKTLNVVWISDQQSVLAFDTGKIGGAISCWYPDGNAEHPKEETNQIHLGGEVFRYHRLNNVITKERRKKMEFKNLPNLKAMTEEKPKEPETPKQETPEKVEKPVEEKPENVGTEPIPAEPCEEKTIEQQLEEAFYKAENLKTLAAELVKELKPLIKAVTKMKKEAGNSAEVKELRAENKELQSKTKALEKEVAAKNQALKLLAGNL